MAKVLIGMLLGMAFAVYMNHLGSTQDPIDPYRKSIWRDYAKCQQTLPKCRLTWEWK